MSARDGAVTIRDKRGRVTFRRRPEAPFPWYLFAAFILIGLAARELFS